MISVCCVKVFFFLFLLSFLYHFMLILHKKHGFSPHNAFACWVSLWHAPRTHTPSPPSLPLATSLPCSIPLSLSLPLSLSPPLRPSLPPSPSLPLSLASSLLPRTLSPRLPVSLAPSLPRLLVPPLLPSIPLSPSLPSLPRALFLAPSHPLSPSFPFFLSPPFLHPSRTGSLFLTCIACREHCMQGWEADVSRVGVHVIKCASGFGRGCRALRGKWNGQGVRVGCAMRLFALRSKAPACVQTCAQSCPCEEAYIRDVIMRGPRHTWGSTESRERPARRRVGLSGRGEGGGEGGGGGRRRGRGYSCPP